MSSTYTGDDTATQAPSPLPAKNATPAFTLPADGDALSAASIAQAHKAAADLGDALCDRVPWLDSANVFSGSPQTMPRLKAAGTPLVAGDFALNGSWGASATVAVQAGSTDMAGRITVTCAGAGISAHPRIIMTFKDGTFGGNGHVQIVVHQDTSESADSGPLYPVQVAWSATAPQWFMQGTPVSTKTYTFAWITIGN